MQGLASDAEKLDRMGVMFNGWDYQVVCLLGFHS